MGLLLANQLFNWIQATFILFLCNFSKMPHRGPKKKNPALPELNLGSYLTGEMMTTTEDGEEEGEVEELTTAKAKLKEEEEEEEESEPDLDSSSSTLEENELEPTTQKEPEPTTTLNPEE